MTPLSSRQSLDWSPAHILRAFVAIPKIHLLFVAAIVFVMAYAGIEFTRQAGRVAVIWPADAVMLAILLRTARINWIPVLVAGFIGNMLADWTAADPFGLALMLSACNTIEIVAAVFLLGRFVSLPPELSRAANLAKFALICGGIAPAISAALAALILHAVNGVPPLPVFQTWFAADALGVLTIAPLLLMLRRDEWMQITSKANLNDAAAILVLVTLSSIGVFLQPYGSLVFCIFPFLILAAFRLRFIGAAVSMAILALVSIPLTIAGYGPFALSPNSSFADRIVLLQVFLAVTVFTILPVAAVLAGRRRLEKETIAARGAAERANTAKSAFLTNMSHELRTPMTGIIGMCDLLLASNQTPQQKNITETLERSARSFLELLNDLLDLAKIEAGHMSLDNKDFRLSEVMKDVQEFFEPAMAQKGIAFKTEGDVIAFDVLRGDPKRLRQVMFNLVGNALKFTDRGSVIIRLQQRRHDSGEIITTIEVADTGIGIAEDVKGRLFRPFEQVDSSASRRYGGTGLGLNICKQLVEAMQGSIGVESARGVGSRFTFSVRLPEGNAAQIEHRFAITPARSGWLLDGLKLSILFAEDNLTTQFLVTEVMSLWGQSVTIVENGRDVIEKARNNKFDIILMDMQMPVMDGPEAVRRIRQSGGISATTPIIALTADAILENRQRYLAAGCDAIVTKPIEWDVLAREINRLVGRTETSPNPMPAVARTVAQHGTEAPLFDVAKIDALREGLSPSLMQGLLKSCIVSMDRYLLDIRQSTYEGDPVRAKRAAHDLKGICAQFGATRASEIARMIEVDLADIDAIKGVVAELEESVLGASAHVQEIQVQL